MRRTRAAVMAAILGLMTGAVALGPSGAALASGGGGCGAPVTDETGTTVTIESFCFSPTVLRTEPGQTVEFSNSDTVGHTVLGANGSWGSFDLLHPRRGTVSYRFVRPGVYAYVCTYHPGMVGTIVVGDASGPGEAGVTTTKDGPVTVVLGDAAPPARSETQARSETGAVVRPAASFGAWPLLAFAAMGLLLAALATIVVQRRSLQRSRSSS